MMVPESENNTNHDLLKVIKGQTWVKSSIYGQIEPKSRNISNIHVFRLKILSRIQIQDYSRSIKVIRGQILVKIIE